MSATNVQWYTAVWKSSEQLSLISYNKLEKKHESDETFNYSHEHSLQPETQVKSQKL